MTEQTDTQTTAPVSLVKALPAPQDGDTKRAYLVRHGLAVAVDKNGVAPRGRFSKAATDALAAAEANGFTFADAPKAKRAPKVAATAVPAEGESSVPAQATPATVVSAPLPEAPEVVRAETQARGRFFGRVKPGRR